MGRKLFYSMNEDDNASLGEWRPVLASDIQGPDFAPGITTLDLGAPILAAVGTIVASIRMNNTAYIIAAQPDVCRNLTVTRTKVGGDDTVGTITIKGYDYLGAYIEEVIIPGATTVTVPGVKCFSVVLSITGAGWVVDGGVDYDTIKVGVGTKLGIPYDAILDVNQAPLGVLGTTITASGINLTSPMGAARYIDMSAGTYNGTKHAYLMYRSNALYLAGHPGSDLYDLGAPVLADADRIVTSIAMKVGAYALAAQPDICRNLTLVRTVVGGADTPGIIRVSGTDFYDAAVQEDIIPGAHGVTVVGVVCFKTITAIDGIGWVIDAPAGEDTIVIGVGNLLGIPYGVIPAVTNAALGILGVAVVASGINVTSPFYSRRFVDMSGSTYDGSKHAYILITA